MELLDDLETLSQFNDHISAFVDWWDWVKTESDPTQDNQPIEYQFDALRDEATVEKWLTLQTQYVAYVEMVKCHPFTNTRRHSQCYSIADQRN